MLTTLLQNNYNSSKPTLLSYACLEHLKGCFILFCIVSLGNRGSITRGWKEEVHLSCTRERFRLGPRLAESQDTKSLASARYLLFPSTSDGTCFSHDKKETFTCFTEKLAVNP